MDTPENNELGRNETSLAKDINDVFEVLVPEVECKVCFLYMTPPITMCENGHSTCSSCLKRLLKCPICKGKLLRTRNIRLEYIIDFTGVPCYYREDGCKAQLQVKNINEHVKECEENQQKTTSVPENTQFAKNIDELLRKLVPVVECSVCLRYMTPPITTCENGHGICKGCIECWLKCIRCKSKISRIRHRSLENILGCTGVPCYFWDKGCREQLRFDRIHEHVTKCPCRPRVCPLSILKESDCTWIGNGKDLENHITHSHSFVIVSDKTKFTVTLPNNDIEWKKIIYTLGEVFYYYCCKQLDKLYSTVLYVGDESNATYFKYRISMLKNEIEESAVAASFVTRPFDYEIKKLFTDKECCIGKPSVVNQSFVTTTTFFQSIQIASINSEMENSVQVSYF